MARKTLSDTGYDALMLGVLAGAGTVAYYLADNELYPFLTFPAALGSYAVHNLYRGIVGRSPHRRRPSAFASIQNYSKFDFKPMNQGGYKATFKTRPAREFVYRNFDSTPFDFRLTAPVPESVLNRFIESGCKRERFARYGQSLTVKTPVTLNTAWSRVYFHKIHKPRILPAVYDDCVKLLVLTGFMQPPEFGRAARLVDWTIGEWGMAEAVKEWWLYLQSHSPEHAPRRGLRKLIPVTI